MISYRTSHGPQLRDCDYTPSWCGLWDRTFQFVVVFTNLNTCQFILSSSALYMKKSVKIRYLLAFSFAKHWDKDMWGQAYAFEVNKLYHMFLEEFTLTSMGVYGNFHCKPYIILTTQLLCPSVTKSLILLPFRCPALYQ